MHLQPSAEVSLPLAGLTSTPLDVDTGVAECDLTLSCTALGGGLLIEYRYSTHLFDRRTVVAFAGRLEHLLESVTSHPDSPMSALMHD